MIKELGIPSTGCASTYWQQLRIETCYEALKDLRFQILLRFRKKAVGSIFLALISVELINVFFAVKKEFVLTT